MGDPLSPGATIIACAWMEMEYMNGLHDSDKKYFEAMRYMDDLLIVCKDAMHWDMKSFLTDIHANCYVAPLKLEDAAAGVFLETEFEMSPHLTFQIKNANKDMHAPVVWRYQHFNSYAPYTRKRATIISALKRVVYFASDDAAMIRSGIMKLQEFAHAGYPYSVLKYCCDAMARDGNHKVWYAIREHMRTYHS